MSRITDILANQHRRVIALLDEAQETAESGAIRSLADEIAGHMLAEEELVYPLRYAPLRAVEEHALLRYALERVLVANPEHLSFDARLRMLRDLLVHHCDREERAELPNLEKTLGARRSRHLAERVGRRFRELVARGYRHALGIDGTARE